MGNLAGDATASSFRMSLGKKYESLGVIALIMAFAILASAGFVTIRAEQYRRDAGASLRHTLMVESALHRLDGAVRRVESDERGSIIAREQHNFGASSELSRRIGRDMSNIATLISDNPQQVARSAQLAPLLEERLALLDQKIELMKQGRFDAAAEIVRTGRGAALMEQVDALISQMIAEEEQLYRMRDETFQRATGSLKTSVAAMIAILGAVAIFSVALTHRQLAALKNAYDQLLAETARREALEAKLRQSQRLEALGQIAGGIAHDFNNMLTVIVASLNILQRKLKRKESDCEAVIDSALAGTHKATNLVRRLLTFSRIQPLTPTILDAKEFIANIASLLGTTLGPGVNFRTSCDEGLWPVRVDPIELENVMLNFAINARDAMPDGGRFTVQIANRRVNAEAAQDIGDIAAGDYVSITVTDSGEGMTPEVAAKAFDPFFTTKPIGQGTGLGLSQAHGFVKQSGGHIEIRSAPGEGATIEMLLPRAEDEP